MQQVGFSKQFCQSFGGRMKYIVYCKSVKIYSNILTLGRHTI